MTIHLDTSILIDALTDVGHVRLERTLLARHRMLLSALVLFEWRRGPRTPEELAFQEALFPQLRIVGFGSAAARIAADVYRQLRRPRSREIDIAIAACAIEDDAALWTLNPQDFRDIPGLRLYTG